MDHYLYLSLVPESLVVSMLPPSSFGTYLATGSRKRAREQALYFDIRPDFESHAFDLDGAIRKCVAHPDGQPKRSVYVSIYRVLERIPLEALGSLWLATRDGRTLELGQAEAPDGADETHHLYHELCPVHPLIASRLAPGDFCRFITDPANSISVPKICFAELRLGDLLEYPSHPDAGDLPYSNIEHLADCLQAITDMHKVTKTVNRINTEHVVYRCIKGGFYVGDGERVLHYPFPSVEALERLHHPWWRSAQLDEVPL